MTHAPFTIGVALDGAGWHPAAAHEWSPDDLFNPARWETTVTSLERAGLDYVTIEDTFSGWASHWRAERPGTPGRLAAHIVAARLSGVTDRIGLIPTITVNHTEPYHVATRLATLDFTSNGRAGWQVRVSAEPQEARLTGLREVADQAPDTNRLTAAESPPIVEAFDEAAAVIDAARKLWDSWEDDAEIRDTATGRFLDADKLHRVDVSTPWFAIAGPSIVPRSPSGQVLVTALAHATTPYRLAAREADVVFVTPSAQLPLTEIVAEIRALEAEVGRTGEPLRIVADVQVVLASTVEQARDRHESLEAVWAGTTDAELVVGTSQEVADQVQQWRAEGAEGVRFRPAENDPDLRYVVEDVLPELTQRGVFTPRPADDDGLRAAFGLSRPASQYSRATLVGAR